MPSLHFELSSKNNVLTEAWAGSDAGRKEYSYDADGYVTQVVSLMRSNGGTYVNAGKTVYAY